MNRDHQQRRSGAQVQRDALLARVTRTRWVSGAAAAALSVGLAALVSALAPGRSSAKTREHGSAETVTARARLTPSMPPAADAAQLGLQPPGSAPQSPPTAPAPQSQPAPSTPAPVSGGS